MRGEYEECSEGRAEPGRAFRVRRRLGGEPSRERSQARDVERKERTWRYLGGRKGEERVPH